MGKGPKTAAQIAAEARGNVGGGGGRAPKAPKGQKAVYNSKKRRWEFVKDTTTTKSPVGVPSGFKTPTPHYDPGRAQFRTSRGGPGQYVPGSAMTKQPLYSSGDEWKLLGGKSPEEIAQVQAALVRIGVLKEGGFQPGVMDKKTAAGFRDILGEANATGRQWRAVLTERTQMADATGYDPSAGSGSERAPLTIELTNPDDIKGKLDQDSPDLIGRGFSDAEKAAFVADYQGQETSAQTQAYNNAESGGTVTGPPSVEAALMKKAKGEFAPEYNAT